MRQNRSQRNNCLGWAAWGEKRSRISIPLMTCIRWNLYNVLKNSGECPIPQDANRSVNKCGCGKQKYGARRPILHANAPMKAGAQLSIDVVCPVTNAGRAHPFLIMVCAMSQFALGWRLRSHKPTTVKGGLFRTWLQRMGKPARTLG